MTEYGQYCDIDEEYLGPIKIIDRTFSFSRQPIIITQMNNIIIQADPMFNADLFCWIRMHTIYCSIIMFLLFMVYRLLFHMKIIV
jgi:hypothetical protein